MHIDPYGDMIMCSFYRAQKIDLTKVDIQEGYHRLKDFVDTAMFETESKCKNCELYKICPSCPGRALLETGEQERHIDYYCGLAKWQDALCERGQVR